MGLMALDKLDGCMKPLFTCLAIVDVYDEILDGHLQYLHSVKALLIPHCSTDAMRCFLI